MAFSFPAAWFVSSSLLHPDEHAFPAFNNMQHTNLHYTDLHIYTDLCFVLNVFIFQISFFFFFENWLFDCEKLGFGNKSIRMFCNTRTFYFFFSLTLVKNNNAPIPDTFGFGNTAETMLTKSWPWQSRRNCTLSCRDCTHHRIPPGSLHIQPGPDPLSSFYHMIPVESPAEKC